MRDAEVEHEMKSASVELVEKDIHLKKRSLVGRNREVLEKRHQEYVCSCGERFDTGRDARDHLWDVQPETGQ